MPFNGSGTFDPPVVAGWPPATGNVISSTAVDTVIDDIHSGLSSVLPRDGQAAMTGNLNMGSNDITSAGTVTATAFAGPLTGNVTGNLTGLTTEPAASVASAATVDLGAQTARYLTVTGTTTITAFGTATAGVWRMLRFAEALTLTHNATSLILPGGANITTAAGDTCTAVSLGSGNWVVTQYQQANGLVQLVQSGTWTPTLTNVTNVTSSTAQTCNYIRVGDMVHFSGTIDVTPTDVNPSTVRCTLPVASNFTSAYDATGTVTALTAVSAARFGNVTADTTNAAITIQLAAGHSGTSMRVNFTGSYRVL